MVKEETVIIILFEKSSSKKATNFKGKKLVLFNVNPRTYTHIHTPTLVQRGGVDRMEPLVEFLICCSISKQCYLQWKAFDLLYKMRYILWVVVLLEACDVTNNGRHLGFCQELEIKLKP